MELNWTLASAHHGRVDPGQRAIPNPVRQITASPPEQWPLPRRVSQRARVPWLANGTQIIEAWRLDYNACRPHTSRGGLAPNKFAAQSRPDYNHNGFWL
jgi:hypothetical protein